ncbi:hypothetical protein ACI2VK_10640 [Ralstonia nicotianae]|uniref:hypothetical protein n=1 Tax=Ralstonia pseudosolanacearum TaxID=1310165 RepID=UPI0009C084AF|nr:hypothetical protein [Ralstonia pseudosolanacearum]AZU59414.1 hypothetical protein CFM90_25185 [Ralstonia solanacearum]MCF1442251.1 hypothetical protein [Ralstonia solanacearum]MCK4136326.1 hypothetical protein [Ralstonia pseudosolanacearum]MCK4153315.1 hypothetical protein [Ralstonia pseudosolanacearum]QVX41448.1 hypothetical protein J4H89_18860 [Ralstonia solanacearum]
MKKPNSVAAIFCATLLLNGCGIGGFWMNGDPSAGKDLKPYIEEWEKPSVTSEMRRRDSESCGGGDSNHAPLFTAAEIKAEQRSGEKENAAYSRLHHRWQRCMLGKGYRYMGTCYSQSSPGCGAP